MGHRKRRGWRRYVNFVTITVTVTAICIILPLYWMVAASFRNQTGINSASFLPSGFSTINYSQTFGPYGFGRYILNSVIVSVISTAVVLVLSTLAGYGLGRTPMRGKLPILTALLMISVFPAVAVIAPLFLVMKTLGWLNSYQALIVPYVAFNLPFSTWIMRNYMLGIAKEMEETARIDGAGPLRTVWSVILPQTRPGIFTAGLFTFTACWAEFLMALSFNSANNYRTIPVGTALFGSQFTVPYGLIFAGCTVAVVPIAVLVLVFRRNVVSGLTAGAVKG